MHYLYTTGATYRSCVHRRTGPTSLGIGGGGWGVFARIFFLLPARPFCATFFFTVPKKFFYMTTYTNHKGLYLCNTRIFTFYWRNNIYFRFHFFLLGRTVIWIMISPGFEQIRLFLLLVRGCLASGWSGGGSLGTSWMSSAPILTEGHVVDDGAEQVPSNSDVALFSKGEMVKISQFTVTICACADKGHSEQDC